MEDETEAERRKQLREINSSPLEREALEAVHGQVWNTEELGREYEVIGFLSPLVVVERRADKVKGSLYFQHWPRYYWGWEEAEP